MRDLQRLVAETSDRLGLHSTAPTLLIDLQARLGELAAEAGRLTERGRRPLRPDAAWSARLGALGFALVNLADQTGVDIDSAVRTAADQLYRSGMATRPVEPKTDAWPFSS